MMPVIPHMANECFSSINFNDQIKWPEIDKKFIVKENNEIVIQINGKKRAVIIIEKDLDEKNILNKIEETKLVEKYIKNLKLIKTIYVKNRLINYIVK